MFVYIISILVIVLYVFFFFQAEDGIRDLVRSRGLGDVYKRQKLLPVDHQVFEFVVQHVHSDMPARFGCIDPEANNCLLYTSDAADDLLCVDLGGRRIIKKKINKQHCDQILEWTHTSESYKHSRSLTTLHHRLGNHILSH